MTKVMITTVVGRVEVNGYKVPKTDTWLDGEEIYITPVYTGIEGKRNAGWVATEKQMGYSLTGTCDTRKDVVEELKKLATRITAEEFAEIKANQLKIMRSKGLEV